MRNRSPASSGSRCRRLISTWAIGHRLLKQTNAGAAVNQAADSVLGAMQNAVLAEKHGSGKPGATGVAIYFPNSQLYRTPVTGPASYSKIASRFASTSLWDDYLAFHYTGRAFDASSQQAVVPESGTDSERAGPGRVRDVARPGLGQRRWPPGSPSLLSTDITAQNLGYVMLFAGYFDPQSNSLFVADMDYLESSDTREVDGVYYPVWPDRRVYAGVRLGADRLLYQRRRQLGARAPEPEVVWRDGRRCRLHRRRHLHLCQWRVAQGPAVLPRWHAAPGVRLHRRPTASAPREIIAVDRRPLHRPGQWLDLDAQGRVVNRAVEQGGTLTFRESMFTWEVLDAAAGDYVVGFIAQDLDGNSQQAYAQIQVQ